jgi:hypothetical protein
MWTQIVGKTRLALSPFQNHWWQVALYVTPRGLTTTALCSGMQVFDVEFDFVEHQLAIRPQRGVVQSIPLSARSVADFYAEYIASLRSIGVEVKLNRKPQEVEDTTPFDEDRHHASYERESVERFHHILLFSDNLLKVFRSRFLGKCSPVHFFWGSFDLAVTRFSGRPAQLPDTVDPITREAYSHEVSSCGFWAGDPRFPYPAFYAYMAPVPAGLDKETLSVGAWNKKLGEHILEYEKARGFASPGDAVLRFFQESYEAGSRLAKWEKDALERRL